jgi:diamine N-acetyltransferase
MFTDTFAADNTPEDMAAYLAKSFSPEIQLNELQDPATTCFIAEIENQAVGFVRLISGDAPDCIPGQNPIELVRIYAGKDWIGHGIGARLMEHSIQFAKENKHDAIWLDVWSKNPRAIRFYEKWGFAVVGEQDFILGSDTQHDYLMSHDL